MEIIPCEYGATLLKAENVTVHREDKLILRALDLEIKNLHRAGVTQGQVVSLLGPSGMGKTTLFRILAGLEAPDIGTVTVEEDCRPVKKGMVGVVAQNYILFEHRTVLGNLVVAGRMAGQNTKDATDKAHDLLTRFGLAEHESKYPTQLSGGQRQRVAIAQQFMCSDHFLLMDEPFSGLDLLAEQNVIELIAEIAASDEMKTFILVTHDIRAALSVSDHIWLLGRDRDTEGKVVPGARIQETYDLVARGIAWHKDVMNTPEFIAVEQEIRARFQTL